MQPWLMPFGVNFGCMKPKSIVRHGVRVFWRAAESMIASGHPVAACNVNGHPGKGRIGQERSSGTVHGSERSTLWCDLIRDTLLFELSAAL
jgi:hypothetical protein